MDVAEIQIFDLLGKEVLSRKLSAGSSSLDISNLRNGMYLIQASDANGAVSNIKFVKN